MSNLNEFSQEAKWYIAHTYSTYENKVKTNLEKVIENRKMQDKILDIRIPTVIEQSVNGEDDEGNPIKTEKERILFPSYVFIKMVMNDETWHIVRNITGVTGFVGPGSKPTPLTDAEVENIGFEVITVKANYKVGDVVRIKGDLFNGYTGKIINLADDGKITVLVSTNGRDMPVQIDSNKIEAL